MLNPVPVHQCRCCDAEFDLVPHEEGYDYGDVSFCPYCGEPLEEELELDEELE